MSLSSATVQAVLQRELDARITGDSAPKVHCHTRINQDESLTCLQIIARIRESTSTISDLPPETQMAARLSWNIAIRTVFIAQIVCGCLVFLTAVFLKNTPLEDDNDDSDEDDESEEER